MPGCTENQMEWSIGFPQNGCCVAQARSGTGDTHNRHRQISHRVENSEAWKSRPKTAGSDVAGGAKTWSGTSLREGSREEEKIVYRTVQSSSTDATKDRPTSTSRRRWKQGAISFTRTTAADTCPDPGEVGCVWHTEKVEDLDGRTSIVHQHFKELFTDPRQKEIPEWIWQRWPYEVLQSLPTIDSERVRDAAYAFRKCTSCADDHLVIEMLRELDQDIWETLARSLQFRLLNHWTEDQDMMWARQLVTMVKKKKVNSQ